MARYAIGNSRLALFLSAAFAGALLEIIAEPSGGFHLQGKSQTGKSTAAFVAASVSGKGVKGRQRASMARDRQRPGGLASRYSDGCLVMDEISQSDAREADASIYQLANGQGKQRARIGQAAHGNAQAGGSCSCSTGEIPWPSDVRRR